MESQTPVGNQALVPLSIKALCLFLTRATHAQAAQLLHLPCLKVTHSIVHTSTLLIFNASYTCTGCTVAPPTLQLRIGSYGHGRICGHCGRGCCCEWACWAAASWRGGHILSWRGHLFSVEEDIYWVVFAALQVQRTVWLSTLVPCSKASTHTVLAALGGIWGRKRVCELLRCCWLSMVNTSLQVCAHKSNY